MEAVLSYQEEVSQITNESGTDTEIAVVDEMVDAEALQEEMSKNLYTISTDACTQEDIDYVDGKIGAVVSRMNELYELTARTDAEYNEYLGAHYI